jgi:hypothetical protein
VVGVGLLETLKGGEFVVAQRSVAVEIVSCADQLRGRGGNVCLGLIDHRLLQTSGGIEIGQGRGLGGDARLSTGELRTVVAIVKLHEQVAGLDRLVVDDGNLFDGACDLG